VFFLPLLKSALSPTTLHMPHADRTQSLKKVLAKRLLRGIDAKKCVRSMILAGGMIDFARA
jgi:hypothetical protein